jgi:hypothetical protein
MQSFDLAQRKIEVGLCPSSNAFDPESNKDFEISMIKY